MNTRTKTYFKAMRLAILSPAGIRNSSVQAVFKPWKFQRLKSIEQHEQMQLIFREDS